VLPQALSGELPKPKVDPFGLVAEELKSVSERLRRTILTDIPLLSTAAEYFFKARPKFCCSGCGS